MMTPQEQAEAKIIDTVTDTITTFQPLHIFNENRVKAKAYRELMRIAQQKYRGNIEIRNITITGGLSKAQGSFIAVGVGGGILSFLVINDPKLALSVGIPIALGINLIGNFLSFTATGDVVAIGDVVLIDSAPSKNTAPVPAEVQKIDNAVNASFVAITNDLPVNSSIAILSIYSDKRSTAEYVIDELEYKFVESGKFKIVDRRLLEQIRREQNFQMSGDVDDNSAVSIGKMLGASIVITGNISTVENSSRLVLRVLDVQTAQIIKMTREWF